MQENYLSHSHSFINFLIRQTCHALKCKFIKAFSISSHVKYIKLLRVCEEPSQIVSVLFKFTRPCSYLTAVKTTL